MSDAKGVRYGVKNVYYAVYDESTGTYGTPVAMKGCTALTLTPVGNTWTFYADDIAYEQGVTNGGYTVEPTIAVLGDDAKRDLLGEVAGTGLQYEVADAKPASVALMWEFEGSKVNKVAALYNVKFQRPTQTGSTTTDTIEPDTDSISGTAIGRDMTIGSGQDAVVKNVIKATASDSDTTYANWFTAVQMPGEVVH